MGGGGGQDGCERLSEVFLSGGGRVGVGVSGQRVGAVRVDLNKELKFL